MRAAYVAAAIAAAVVAAVWWSDAARRATPRDAFLSPIFYAPKCDPTRVGDTRPECRGLSTGAMPAIEDGRDGAGGCPGRLGVPPGYPLG